jgi:membrane-associated phospholipid phosphatase
MSGRRWIAWIFVRNSWFRFWEDARQLPNQVWKRWAKVLGIGFIVTTVVAFAVTFWAKSAVNSGGLQAWDEQMLIGISQNVPLSFARSITWESPGNLVYMLPLIAGVVLTAVWRSHPVIAATVVAAYILQFAFAWTGWLYWNRQRPDLIAEGLAAPSLHSYPSGHTLIVTSVYGFLFYLWFRLARGGLERSLAVIAGLFWVGMVSIARLILGAHWPSDVIAGLVIGICWLTTVIVAFHRANTDF